MRKDVREFIRRLEAHRRPAQRPSGPVSLVGSSATATVDDAWFVLDPGFARVGGDGTRLKASEALAERP